MMDFDKIVKNILFEEEEAPAPEASPSSDDEAPKNIHAFLINTTPKPYNILQSLWKLHFKLFPFPSEMELNTICFGVTSSISRFTKNADKFPNFESVFPIIDLICQLYESHFKGKANINVKSIQNTFDAFIKGLNGQINNSGSKLIPMEYKAAHPWANAVKASYLSTSRDELGKLRLDAQNGSLSLYQTIINLLEIRKKIISIKLPKFLRNTTEKPIVDDILLEPWNLISGTYAINDEKVKLIYDELSVDRMVRLSLACYKLYQQQVSTNIKEDVTDVTHTTQRYAQFMGVSGPTPFQWLAKGQAPSILESFNRLYECIDWSYIEEAGEADLDERTRAEIVDDVLKALEQSKKARKSSNFESETGSLVQSDADRKKIRDAVQAALARSKTARDASGFRGSSVSDKQRIDVVTDRVMKGLRDSAAARASSGFRGSLQTPAQKTRERVLAALRQSRLGREGSDFRGKSGAGVAIKPFETKAGMGTFVYSLDKIREASNTYRVEEATQVLENLKGLADYIKTKESADLLGGAGKVATGLSLGVRNMGD